MMISYPRRPWYCLWHNLSFLQLLKHHLTHSCCYSNFTWHYTNQWNQLIWTPWGSKTELLPWYQQTKACKEAKGKEGCPHLHVNLPTWGAHFYLDWWVQWEAIFHQQYYESDPQWFQSSVHCMENIQNIALSPYWHDQDQAASNSWPSLPPFWGLPCIAPRHRCSITPSLQSSHSVWWLPDVGKEREIHAWSTFTKMSMKKAQDQTVLM